MVRAMVDQSLAAGAAAGTGGGTGPRYGLLGGTFDPPHFAHLALAQEALVRLGLDQIVFIPTGQSPHKRGRAVSPADDRRAMMELAIGGEPRFAVSTVDLDRAGPSYTADTLRRLRAEWGPTADLSLILGWDMLLDLPRWREPESVVGTANHVIAAHRPGYAASAEDLAVLARALPELPPKLVVVRAPELSISASMLRERVIEGLPIRYFVPDAVARYIHDHGLYRQHGRGSTADVAMADVATPAEDGASGDGIATGAASAPVPDLPSPEREVSL